MTHSSSAAAAQLLLKKYSHLPQVTALIKQLKNNKQSAVKGVKGASLAMLISSCFSSLRQHFFVVKNDKEQAAYLYNDLQEIIGKNKVEFLPSSYRRSAQYGSADPANILLRTDVLSKLTDKEQPIIIVSYPEAIMEKVIAREQLKSNTFTIKKGDLLSMNFMIELLYEYKFERVDFVYEPGQFAIRGSLIDVFSFAGEAPFRIDFFGDAIDKLRIFDIATQLSISEPDKMVIIPNMQEDIAHEKRITIFEFLPENTCYWFADFSFCKDKIKEIAQALLKSREDILSIENEIISDENILEKHLKSSAFVSFEKAYQEEDTFYFDTSLQPSIKKNFKLLSSVLNEFSEQNYTNYLLSSNQEQINRLHAIFEDSEAKANFTPLLFSLSEGFIDHDLKICCFTDHQIFERYHKFHLKTGFTKKESITLSELSNLHTGDYVVHIDHGIGKFGGLQKIEINGKEQETIKLIYRDNDVLFVSIHSLHRISKYKGKDTEAPEVHKLGSAVWKNLKAKTKSKVKDIAKDLIKLYAERKSKKGFAFSADSFMNRQLEASFIYEDTPDQMKTTLAVKEDMENAVPMDRLVCGDVGFGKTEIAIRAAFKAVADNKQVAVLVPTTILAMQHYQTFKERLADFPCTVNYISRLRSAKEQKQIKEELKSGLLNIVIGTHKLVSKDLKFKDLGLLIIDEEQKFGVSVKEKLKQLKLNVDTLTLTATPIPRTLQFSLMGARDLSIINTPPPNRQAINTEVHTFNEAIIREAIDYELNRQGQVFFIHNRVKNIEEVIRLINRICPRAKTVAAHGQMEGKKLENIMLEFIAGKYDVLVATTIIESGLDIPNANTIIINQAQNYGLSDLHQLRGRVGRSNKKAFCYLLSPPPTLLSNDARRRLKAIEDFSELGSGFNISLQDLDIRGAGNILGAEQSGFIGNLGFEAYQRILDEALLELKENELKTLYNEPSTKPNVSAEVLSNLTFVNDCFIDTDLELLFPESYISSMSERINLYRKLDTLKDEEELTEFKHKLIDRFGAIPKESLELLQIVNLRKIAMQLAIEKLYLKNKQLRAFFVSDQSSLFYQSPQFQFILKQIQYNRNCNMQEKNDKLTLTFENIDTVNEAYQQLSTILLDKNS